MSGNQISRILDARGAFEHRLHQIAQHARCGRHQRQTEPRPYIGIQYPRGDIAHRQGAGQPAEESLPRLFGRKTLEHAVPSEGHSHQIGEDIVGPNDEDVENHHPRSPHVASDDRDIAHQRKGQRNVADAHQRRADSGSRILLFAVKFADEHRGYQQEHKGHSAGKSLTGAAQNLDVVRYEREIKREKHDARRRSQDPLRGVALFLGQSVKFEHAADEHRQQQCAETPLRPHNGTQHHHCEDCAAKRTHHEVLHFFTHQIYQRVRFVG